MRKIIPWLFCLALFVPLPSLMAADVGVVLLHGKDGMPGVPPLADLTAGLKRSGFKVATPEMPYSRRRQYDKTYEDTMKEIDALVVDLRKQGAGCIVIAGHSLGANVSLHYATGAAVDGVLAIAPGHVPELKNFVEGLKGSLDAARKMVEEGRENKQGLFGDLNQGRSSTIKTTARIYLSWFDPEGPAVMPKSAAALKPGTVLLWVIGTKDPLFPRGPSYAFEKAPANPRNKYLVVDADHMGTPRAAAEAIIEWLKGFKSDDGK